MSHPDPLAETAESRLDAEIADLLEQYLASQERGEAVSRVEFLAQNPQHADRLAACLDGIQLLNGNDPLGVETPAGDFSFDEVGVHATAFSESGNESPPTLIGDFEILGELGRGGMGVVYEAREKSLDRVVALKVMRFGIVDPRSLERFQREAETAGSLHHTNIVPVYATGREGDTSWYAMQRIEGQSLAARINGSLRSGTKIGLTEILDVGIQAAEALDHAHQRDVVHRDVKPANLILETTGRVWLTDFGLARRLVDVGATMTGAMLGTPRYMSPEQADFRIPEVDLRTDVYSLGATLFEMACGVPVVQGDDALEVIASIRSDDPPGLHSMRPDLPRDLNVVLQKCLAKTPDRRYQSAAELANDLRAIQEDRAIQARPVSVWEHTSRWVRRNQSRLRISSATVVLTAAVLGAMIFVMNRWNDSQLGSFRLRAGDGPYEAELRPDGESRLDGNSRQLTLPMQTQLKLPTGDYEMLVAPRGKWSRQVHVPIGRGLPSEYQLSSEPGAAPSVAIDDALAVTVASDVGPAILIRERGRLRRVFSTLKTDEHDQPGFHHTASGSRLSTNDITTQGSWDIDVSAIEAIVTPIETKEMAGEDGESTSSITVNFAQNFTMDRIHHGHRVLDDKPLLATGVQALRTPIDLNGNGRSDTLIAATSHAALMALNESGETLWSRAYQLGDFPTENLILKPNSSLPSLPLPSVYDLLDAGDLDGDQTSDLLVTVASIDFTRPTEIASFVVSGRTGQPIRTLFRHQFTRGDQQFWPVDGVFALEQNDLRSYRGLKFDWSRASMTGSYSTLRYSIRQVTNGTPVRVALPSPTQIIEAGEQRIAVFHVGDQCHRVDVETGKPILPVITLPFMVPRKPKIAYSGESAKLIFHEPEPTYSNVTGKYGAKCHVYHLDGTLAWTFDMENVDWASDHARNEVDWPVVADLDHDGTDEIILPQSHYRNGVHLGVQLLDSKTGKRLWPARLSPQLRMVASQSVTRITSADDINLDGWDDIATAVIAGPGINDDLSRGTLGRRFGTNRIALSGEVYVYIDWISGKTGQPLAWARSRIPVLSDKITYAEVDAIRTRLPGMHLGVVEVDFLTSGDSLRDVDLESSVLRFHPSQTDPVGIAAGLDVCPTPSDTSSSVRVYRNRGGPFGVGTDQLRLLEGPTDSTLRLGENEVLAAWTNRLGQRRIAVQGFDPIRISVLDPITKKTVWMSDRNPQADDHWTVVSGANHQVDFLKLNHRGVEAPPQWIDGETGNVKRPLSEIVGGRIKVASLVDEGRSLLVVGDGRISGLPGTNRRQMFQLSKFYEETGQQKWKRSFLHGAPRSNHPYGFDDLQLADLTGDGVDDIVGPDSTSNGDLFLAAWDGQTGASLWKQDVGQRAVRTDYYVPFQMVTLGDRHAVAFIAAGIKSPSDKPANQCELRLCDNKGSVLATHELDGQSSLRFLDRQSVRGRLSFHASHGENASQMAMVTNDRGRVRTQIFDLIDENLNVVYDETEDLLAGGRLEVVWLRDLNGSMARIEVERVSTAGKKRDEKGGVNDRNHLLVRRFGLTSKTPDWSLTLPEDDSVSAINWNDEMNVADADADTSIAWLDTESSERVAIDMIRGTVLARVPFGRNGDAGFPQIIQRVDGLPELLTSHRDGISFTTLPNLSLHNGLDGAPFLADRHQPPDASPEGLRPAATLGRAELVSEQGTNAGLRLPSPLDPRRSKSLVAQIGGPLSLEDWILQSAQSLAAFSVYCLMPLWYLVTSVRSRRWGLSWLMLAPLVTPTPRIAEGDSWGGSEILLRCLGSQ